MSAETLFIKVQSVGDEDRTVYVNLNKVISIVDDPDGHAILTFVNSSQLLITESAEAFLDDVAI